jgi:hypothetical protein
MQLNAHDVGLKIGAQILARRAKQTESPAPVPANQNAPQPSAQGEPIFAPVVNVETAPPVVNVTTPEVIVNIAAPVIPEPIIQIQSTPAPVVNVTTPEVVVNVPAPLVNVTMDTAPIAQAILSLAEAVKGNREELAMVQVELRGQADAIVSLADAMTAPRSLVLKDGKPVGIVVKT